jgi:1,4-alpha-glucan branching enzyme
MPYVRRNGDWPCGEQWILEAWAECYLPVWELVDDLAGGRARGKLALTLTPILAEQLRDTYLESRFQGYLLNRIRQAEEEIARLEGMGDRTRADLARFYRNELRGLLRKFEERFRGRMVETLARAMDSGKVEVLASAATHAHLPSLGSYTCRRAQVAVGIEEYRRLFHREPAGFWLPECAYTPELDRVLAEFSPPLRYVVLDHSAARDTSLPRRLGDTPLVALLRDGETHRWVWTETGIPSRGPYREYCKRDHQGHGFQYWKVTSLDTPLDLKEIYRPEEAVEQAERDAREFAGRVMERLECILRPPEGDGESAMDGYNRGARCLLAAYDTELMGHWWWEGPYWLREVLSLLEGYLELPARVAAGAPVHTLEPLSPRETSWAPEGDFSPWINPRTAWMWETLHRAQERFVRALSGRGRKVGSTPLERRALAQAGRELLLLQSSDWPYMVSRDSAAGYSEERFCAHAERFHRLLDLLEEGDERGLGEVLPRLELLDNPFPFLGPQFWKMNW